MPPALFAPARPTESDIARLLQAAEVGRKNAYAIRSGHRIGAAVLSADGQTYAGGNIESVISGLGTCAERAAMMHAICHGDTHLVALATTDTKPVPPCGACLQFALMMGETCGTDLWLIFGAEGQPASEAQVVRLSEYFPQGYRTSHPQSLMQQCKISPDNPAPTE